MTEAHREQFGVIVRELSRHWRRALNYRLKPLGLSQAQWTVIMHLNRATDGLVQHELAEKVGIEAPSLVRLLDRMGVSGWIERRESPTDRRCKLVHLTAKAHATACEIDDVMRNVRAELLADLSLEDLAHCERVFQLISQRADAIASNA